MLKYNGKFSSNSDRNLILTTQKDIFVRYYQVLNKRPVSFINFTTVFPQCPCLLRTYRLLIFGLRTSTAGGSTGFLTSYF